MESMPRADRAQRFLVNPHGWMDDPAVQRMSLEARGAYAVLWLAGWDQKEPGVYVADDRVLAQLARCTPDEWSRVRDEVVTAFVTERDRWLLPQFAVTLRQQNAKRDADAKRQQRKRMRDRDVTPNGERDSLDGSGSGSGTGTDKKTFVIPEWIPTESWNLLEEHRAGPRMAKLTDRARALCVKKLDEFRKDGFSPAEVIENSVANGYRGLFAPSRNGHGNGHASPELKDWEVTK